MINYLIHILVLTGIYIILTISLNLIAGYTGILSIAHATFYGIGAYITALLALNTHSPFVLNLILSILGAVLLGGIIGIPSLRIKDDYFVIATFAFQIIIYSILNNWVSFTGGPLGLPGIPQPNILGLEISSPIKFLVVILILVIITFWISRRIVNSSFGRVLIAIREDEVFVQSLGKDVFSFKVKVFMISAGLAAISGVLYATYIRYIDPSSFTIMESIFIISIVIIGGAGSLWGSVLGASLIIILPELLRFIGLPDTIAANIRQLLYGSLLVLFMLWRPKGLIGKDIFFTIREQL